MPTDLAALPHDADANALAARQRLGVSADAEAVALRRGFLRHAAADGFAQAGHAADDLLLAEGSGRHAPGAQACRAAAANAAVDALFAAWPTLPETERRQRLDDARALAAGTSAAARLHSTLAGLDQGAGAWLPPGFAALWLLPPRERAAAVRALDDPKSRAAWGQASDDADPMPKALGQRVTSLVDRWRSRSKPASETYDSNWRFKLALIVFLAIAVLRGLAPNAAPKPAWLDESNAELQKKIDIMQRDLQAKHDAANESIASTMERLLNPPKQAPREIDDARRRAAERRAARIGREIEKLNERTDKSVFPTEDLKSREPTGSGGSQ